MSHLRARGVGQCQLWCQSWYRNVVSGRYSIHWRLGENLEIFYCLGTHPRCLGSANQLSTGNQSQKGIRPELSQPHMFQLATDYQLRTDRQIECSGQTDRQTDRQLDRELGLSSRNPICSNWPLTTSFGG